MLDLSEFVPIPRAIKLDPSQQIAFHQRSADQMTADRMRQAEVVKKHIRSKKLYSDVGENIPFAHKLEKIESNQKRYEQKMRDIDQMKIFDCKRNRRMEQVLDGNSEDRADMSSIVARNISFTQDNM